MDHEKIIVLDFGGQYNQLIARRVRECNVYCEVQPYTLSALRRSRQRIRRGSFSPADQTVFTDETSPRYTNEIYEMGVPILGICYGAQLMAYQLGGKVETAPVSEYGRTEVDIDSKDGLFQDVADKTICWMSHTDYISEAPEGFKVTAHTPVCPVAAMENKERKLYALQPHPEVMHTVEGMKMLSCICIQDVCGCSGDWQMGSFVENTIQAVREKVGRRQGTLCTCPAVWIPPWQLYCCPRRWANSSPAYSWITVFCGKTKETRWKPYSDPTVRMS